VDEEVHEMFTMGAEMMALPMDEKMKFEQGDDGMTFGFILLICIKTPLTFSISLWDPCGSKIIPYS
jgi:hypothetical protein